MACAESSSHFYANRGFLASLISCNILAQFGGNQSDIAEALQLRESTLFGIAWAQDTAR